ncbi:hypothetical protein GF325_16445 [Candidatus Bathyarchaeota archaeon]|nr:hypothetical protein [Candidatus Bathyarchaeota archaeon]
MQVLDNHLHTRVSHCCHQNYGLQEVVDKLSLEGLPYACTTDHVHNPGDGTFLPDQLSEREMLMGRGSSIPVFIGIEASIISRDGRMPLDGLPTMPDFVIAGDHWIPGSGISMADLPGGFKLVGTMHDREPQQLDSIYDTVVCMYCQAIRNEHVVVLVHPFDTFQRIGNSDKRLLDKLETVCDACQDTGTALEINNASARRCVELHHGLPLAHEDCMAPTTFFEEMYRIAARYDITFSTCSDAHEVHLAGNTSLALNVARKSGINESRFLDLRSLISRKWT